MDYFFEQVSQYTFAVCSYREKKAEPTELQQLDGLTIDYKPAVPGKLENNKKIHTIIIELAALGGKQFFSGIKEGDELVFATDDDNERHLWVQVI